MTQSLPLPPFDRPVKLLIVAVTAEAATAAQEHLQSVKPDVTLDLLLVPSILELPPAIAMAERLADFDGYVALGTAEGHQLQEVWRQLGQLGLYGACIGNGVGPRDAASAADAALHLVAISRKWAAETKGIGFRP